MLVYLLALLAGLAHATCPVPASLSATTVAYATANFFTATPTNQASCQTYSDYLSDGSLGFCKGIVNYKYYRPFGATQVYLDQVAENKTTGSKPKNAVLLSILPSRCTLQLKRSVCLAVFQACEMVDMFFLDRSCGSFKTCLPCGTAVANTPPTTDVAGTKSYGSKCDDNTASKCIVGPGKAPGHGDMLWADAKAIDVTFSGDTWYNYCKSFNLGYDSITNGCKWVLARTPCKGALCDPLWNTNVGFGAAPTYVPNAICPLISKNFSTELNGLIAAYARDANIVTQLTNALGTNNLLQKSSIPLLAAFKLNPFCSAISPPSTVIFDFSITYAGEFSNAIGAPDRAASLGGFITAKAANQTALNLCHCISNPLNYVTGLNAGSVTCPTGVQTCSQLISAAACHSAGGSDAIPNSSVKLTKDTAADLQPVCKDIIEGLNQPTDAELAVLGAGLGVSATVARGAYFVPPYPGLPALASGSQQSNLCVFPSVLGTGQNFTGTDSYSCVMAKVKSAIGLIPSFIGGTCRRRYVDLLCNTAHMKLQTKTLCLVPTGCASNYITGASTHTIPFLFALPRFPRRTMCQAFHTDCAGFISTLAADKQALIASTFDCTGLLNQNCLSNHPDRPSSIAWSCTSSLNGLPSYPEFSQSLADLNSFGLEGDYSSVGASTSSDSSSILLTNTTTCSCPYPLVVPKDPNALTIKTGVCCAEVCEATLFKATEIDHAINIVRIMSIFSFVGTLIMCLLVFKSQGASLVFFMCHASMQWSLSLLIPSWNGPTREMWCKDNTQQNEQHDGLMCLFQSIWFIFWSLNAICFWAGICWDVYQRVCKSNKKTGYMKFHAVAWFLPFFVIMVVLAKDLAGYEARTYWCLFRETHTEAEKWVTLGLYYGSVVAVWFFGFMCIQLILPKMKTAEFKESKGLVLFIFAFSLIWPVLWGFKYIAVGETNKVKAGAQDWVTCLLGNFAVGIPNPATSNLSVNLMMNKYGIANGSGCGESYPLAPGGFGITAIAISIISFQGFILFINLALGLKAGTIESAGSKNADSSFQDMDKGGMTVADGGAKNPVYKS